MAQPGCWLPSNTEACNDAAEGNPGLPASYTSMRACDLTGLGGLGR